MHLCGKIGSINRLSVVSHAFRCGGLPVLRRLPVAGRACHRDRRSAMTKAAGKQIISTEEAPAAVGPYSQAIRLGNLLFVSGQVPLVPGTKDLVSSDVQEQAEQCLKNIGAILAAAGTSFESVVKTTVLLMDMGDFAKVNEVYGRYFPEAPPARVCYAVKTLPLGALVEIDAIASAP